MDKEFHMVASSWLRGTLTVLILCMLNACANVQKVESLEYNSANPRFILMPLDVELSILTASGLQEPQAEWTKNATDYILSSLKGELNTRQMELSVFQKPEDAGPDSTIQQLNTLHEVLGYTVLFHHLGPVKLPNKKGEFDWTLGPDVAALKAASDADYAMFVFVRDSYASAGRVAFQIGAALLGASVPGGQQMAFASVVDLNTGDIVWFNRLISTTGDLRNQKEANKSVANLLKGLPSA
jgi:hypothetical protein